MNPSRNNNNQYSNNQSSNFPQYNTNFFNAGQPYVDNRINQEQDEDLLEDSVDQVTGQTFSRKTSFKQNPNPIFSNSQQNDPPIQYQAYQNFHQNYGSQGPHTSMNPSYRQNFFSTQSQSNQPSYGINQSYSNQQFSQTFSQPQTRIQNTNALSRASKLDQSLMLIFRQNLPENAPGSKAASKIEEKSKKAVSRLSHQFFGKSGNAEENMKSKKKSRQTVASFVLDQKNDLFHPKNEETGLDQQKNSFQKPNTTASQAQKMEIESKIDTQHNKNSPPNQQQKESLSLLPPQNRMSEVKIKRQRLSSGIEGLANLLKNFGSDKKEKKPASPSKTQPPSKQNNRVTMDMNSLISFLQSNDNQATKPSGQTENAPVPSLVLNEKQKESRQRNHAPQITEHIRRFTEYIKPSMRLSENIIFEQQDEDQVTPLKSPLRQRSIPFQRSIKKLDSIFLKQGRKSLQEFALESERKMMANVAKDHYTRQVFNRYFCNLNERLNQQKQLYEQLTRQKTQIVKDINQKLSEFTIDAEKLAQWKEQEHKIRQKIYSIKQKVSKSSFDKYSQVIHKFQLTFGIQLHRLQKTQLDDGFYIEFTYDDLLFRVHRSNKLNETKCKFLERLVLKKTKKDFEFRMDQKTNLIQSFINKKLKPLKNVTPFMIQLIRYLKALEKLELTMAHYAYINNTVKEFILQEKSSEMEFTFTTGSKFDFVFSVDLMELMENGGIKVHRSSDGKNIEIPEELLKFQNANNKIGKCFIFLEKYVAQSVIKDIENAAKTE